jgi:nitrous oxidase accessory protein
VKKVVACFLLLMIIAASSHSKTIRVGSKEDIKSIKRGVEVAVDGDTVLVFSGVYKEQNIVIEKSICIIGLDFPILDGEKKYEIFTIHADNVLVSGLSFVNTGVGSINDYAAIKTLDSKRVRIIGNRFNNTFFGIYFANSSDSWVLNNELKSFGDSSQQIGNGIHMWKCSHMTVKDNRVQGHRDGIYFEFVTNSLIENNYSERNIRYGLHFMFSHNDEYRNNHFVRNGAGVAVMYTKGVKMFNNVFDHNWGSSAYGLLLKDIRDSWVVGNIFHENSVGIFMEGSSRIEFSENTFKENGYAVKLMASCDDNTFRKNNFLANTFDLATNGTLVLNTINGNYWDRYEGYDLNKDKIGDVPHRPVSMFSYVIERVPAAVLLWRSFLVFLVDRSEKAIPAITPENLKDELPSMKPYDFN